jgi:hypothetical protein
VYSDFRDFQTSPWAGETAIFQSPILSLGSRVLRFSRFPKLPLGRRNRDIPIRNPIPWEPRTPIFTCSDPPLGPPEPRYSNSQSYPSGTSYPDFHVFRSSPWTAGTTKFQSPTLALENRCLIRQGTGGQQVPVPKRSRSRTLDRPTMVQVPLGPFLARYILLSVPVRREIIACVIRPGTSGQQGPVPERSRSPIPDRWTVVQVLLGPFLARHILFSAPARREIIACVIRRGTSRQQEPVPTPLRYQTLDWLTMLQVGTFLNIPVVMR